MAGSGRWWLGLIGILLIPPLVVLMLPLAFAFAVVLYLRAAVLAIVTLLTSSNRAAASPRGELRGPHGPATSVLREKTPPQAAG